MNKYLSIFRNRQAAESSDGSSIQCNYQKHPRFSFECELCAGLHYVFIRFASERTYSKVYSLRTAINLFFDYAMEYEERNPPSLKLTTLLRISPEVYRGFDFYTKRNKAPKGMAQRLKGALSSVSMMFDEGMPQLMLPVLDKPESEAFEPLTEECFHQLVNALKTHIDSLYVKLDLREAVTAAEPYALDVHTNKFEALYTWLPDPVRALKTFIVNGHPFTVPHASFLAMAQRAHNQDYAVDPEHIVEALYSRYNHPRIRYSVRPGKLISLNELFNLYFPNSTDQAAIACFLQLQTGWNKETVIAIDGENFVDAIAGALSSNIKLIYSEKQKSQSNNTPYFSPKRFSASSDVRDKYGSYNLIMLAKSLSEPLSKLPRECGSDWAMKNHNPSFLCMRNYAQMCATTTHAGTRPGRYISIANKATWEYGIAKFLETYEIHEQGERLRAASDLSGRLRPTWIRFHRDKHAKPLSVIALQQGHKSIETTDIHYDTSGQAMQMRRDRLKSELNKVIEILRKRRFKGILGKKGKPKVKLSTLRFFSIPGHDRHLWACADSKKPDWPGAPSELIGPSGCAKIDRCLFCSQVYIYSKIPYRF